jgi:hypothetical protein
MKKLDRVETIASHPAVTGQGNWSVAEVVRELAAVRGVERGKARGADWPEVPRVLVVGNNSNVASFVSVGLRFSGYKTYRAPEDQAVTASQQIRPDLLLLDAPTAG